MLQVNYYRFRIHSFHLLWFASVSSYTVASHELTLSCSIRHAWNYFLQYLRCSVLIVYTYQRAALSILVKLKFAWKLEIWCFERIIERLKPIINIEKKRWHIKSVRIDYLIKILMLVERNTRTVAAIVSVDRWSPFCRFCSYLTNRWR